VLKGFPGMLVLLLQGARVAFVLCQPRREAGNALLQLGQFGGAAGHLALGGFARLAFCLQSCLGALKLHTEVPGLLPGLFQGLGALVQLGLEPFLCLRDHRFGLDMQPFGQTTDQVLQGVADRDFGAWALPFLLFQLLQVAVDGGFGPGVAQRHADGVYRGVLAFGPEAVPGTLHIAFVQARPSHASSPVIA